PRPPPPSPTAAGRNRGRAPPPPPRRLSPRSISTLSSPCPHAGLSALGVPPDWHQAPSLGRASSPDHSRALLTSGAAAPRVGSVPAGLQTAAPTVPPRRPRLDAPCCASGGPPWPDPRRWRRRPGRCPA